MSDRIAAIPVKTIYGRTSMLDDYAGRVLLIVNVASKCGLTPQYTALEQLYQRHHAHGLDVLGFPANDFAGQEPGTEAEIQAFCTLTYAITFPMFAKLEATGANKHPLYAALTAARPDYDVGDADVMRANLAKHGIEPTSSPEVLWNFEKFLVGRDGQVIGRFTPDTTPDNPALATAIMGALG
jgi:glutathione peroxidase